MVRSILFVLLLIITLSAQATPLDVSSTIIAPTCMESNGSIEVDAFGGTPPYTYLWDDGPVLTTRTGLVPGDYTLHITDGLGTMITRTYTLVASPGLVMPGTTYAGGFPCPGMADGQFAVVNSITNGAPPFTVDLTVNGVTRTSSGTNIQGDPVYSGVARGDQVDYTVTDATGCSGQYSFVVEGPLGMPLTFSGEIASCNGTGGAITIEPSNLDWPVDLEVHDANFIYIGESYQSVSPLYLTDLHSGDYTVQQSWTFGFNHFCNTVTTPFSILDLGPDCGFLSGNSWYDVDGDCMHDAGEVGIPYSPLLVQPGAHYVLTDADGHYRYPLVSGNYTLEQTDPTLVSICPATQPVPLTVSPTGGGVDLANGSTVPLDLRLYASAGNARPGFAQGLYATVYDASPQVSGPVTITCTFDPAETFMSASPVPSTVVGNVITWQLGAFNSFGSASVVVLLNVPVATPLGTVLNNAFTVSNTLPESSLGNNSAGLTTTVVGSFDPNDKSLRTSSGAQEGVFLIEEDDHLDYTIRFQNTGTAEAIDVVVTDTLDEGLDMGTFEQGVASHPFTVSFLPDRVVEWRFANILLPDSGSDEAASHGLVGFRIKPKMPWVAGTVIGNVVDIFFDANPPIRTNTASVVIESSTDVQAMAAGTLGVFPSPAEEVLNIQLPDQQDGVQRVWVIASDGRVVRSEQVVAMAGRAVLSVRGIAPGAYVLRLEGQGNSREIVRFVKR